MQQHRYSTDGVREEQTGWRDDSISQRHRRWGFDCPAVDIDFLLLEYNFGRPVALIEYKTKGAGLGHVSQQSYQAIRMLADGYRGGALPFLVALYDKSDWSFIAHPLNDAASAHYQTGQELTEREYVESLYRLRGIRGADIECKIIEKLNG